MENITFVLSFSNSCELHANEEHTGFVFLSLNLPFGFVYHTHIRTLKPSITAVFYFFCHSIV